MARASLHRRDIGPGFWDNEDLVDLGSLARLFFMAMWCQADREGRLEDRPRRIRLKANMTDIKPEQAEELTHGLAAGGFIHRYEIAGIRYIQIAHFARHQRVHPRERASEIPAMEAEEGRPRASLGCTEGEPRCSEGGTFRSGPSGPSGPSGDLEATHTRTREAGDHCKARADDGLVPPGLPPEARHLAGGQPPTEAQAEQLAALIETTGTALDDAIPPRYRGKPLTKRAASVAIDRLLAIRDQQRKAARASPQTYADRVTEHNRRLAEEIRREREAKDA